MTPSDVKFLRLCTEYEKMNKSPCASYHQHALVSPDTLSLVLPEKLQDREATIHL